ncbi:hypothetical protein BBFL7_00486 [Flavobacteria bacterium BBFL7]|nr:hypothetical protein BBFL7_00486 [Flavobacteria bacterium BBFL7]
MKHILFFILILISNYSFSQENIQEITKEQERLEDLARSAYYEKDGQLLFHDIFDQPDRWGFRENMTADELRAYIKDLDQVKAKWEAPNGPLELALSRVDNFHAYNDKLCTTYGAVKTANSDHTMDWCKIRDDYKRTYPRKSAAYENAMGYWQRFYDYANELLEKKGSNSSGNSSSDSSNSNSTSTSYNTERTNSSNIETSEERIKRLDRERGEQITRETQNNVARVKANSEQFGNNLNNIISSVFSKDRSNEAIIRNKYDENKAFISNYDKEYEAYQQALEEERISEISFFKDFSENPENAKLIIEIQKSFEIGYCTNKHCENGYVKDTKLTLCDSRLDGCNGKGYVEVGAFIPIGQTAHPNDGKEKHEKCNGSGIIQKTKESYCTVCNGNYKNNLNYVGNSSYSTSFLNEFKKKYREEIVLYVKAKQFFIENTEIESVELPGGKLIDRSLNLISLSEDEKQKKFFSNYKSDNSLIADENDGLFGFIDSNNNVIIDHQYLFASDMIDGSAIVQRTDKKIGMIDEKNNKLIKIEYDNLVVLNKNTIAWIKVVNNNPQVEISNRAGEIDNFIYTNIEELFKDTHYIITTENKKNMVFVSPNLTIKNVSNYDRYIGIHCLSLKKDDKESMYFLEKDFTTEFYDDIENFRIDDDGKEGNINKAFYKTYDSDSLLGYIQLIESYKIDELSNQLIINQKINLVEPKFKTLNYVKDTYFIVENQINLKGVIDINTNEEIIPISYLNIESIEPNLILVENENQFKGVINIETKKNIVPVSYSDIQITNERRGTFFLCKDPNEENSRIRLKYNVNGDFIKKTRI